LFAEIQRLRRQRLTHVASSSGATVAVRGKLGLIGGSARAIGRAPPIIELPRCPRIIEEVQQWPSILD
jgi:hypothetical protein